MANLVVALPTWSDIGRHPQLKMSAMKAEVEIIFQRKEMAKRFQRLPHILDHARLKCGTANLVRDSKLKMSATKPEVISGLENRPGSWDFGRTSELQCLTLARTGRADFGCVDAEEGA